MASPEARRRQTGARVDGLGRYFAPAEPREDATGDACVGRPAREQRLRADAVGPAGYAIELDHDARRGHERHAAGAEEERDVLESRRGLLRSLSRGDEGIESVSLNPDTVVETWLYLGGESVG